MISITFDDTKFQSRFARTIEQAKNPRAILMNAGREVGNQLKTHFQRRDNDNPNKMGGQRSHFWLAVSRSINGSGNVNDCVVSGNMVTISINHPAFAQKVFGGPIDPKEKGALTIPLTPAAYGKTVQDFPGSFLIHTLKGAFIVKLGENITVSGIISRAKRGEFKSQRATLNFLFKLVGHVDQAADPAALPDKTALETAILYRADRVLSRQLSGQSPAAEDAL
jgi:hypothetical protein